MKNSARFRKLPTVIANISETDRRNENLETTLSTTIPSLLGAKNLMNVGPQTKKL